MMDISLALQYYSYFVITHHTANNCNESSSFIPSVETTTTYSQPKRVDVAAVDASPLVVVVAVADSFSVFRSLPPLASPWPLIDDVHLRVRHRLPPRIVHVIYHDQR